MTLEITSENSLAVTETTKNNIIRITRSDINDSTLNENQGFIKTKTTLLTGATGALGQELMWNFLQNRPVNEKLVVLARGKTKKSYANNSDSAKNRINSLLCHHFGEKQALLYTERVSVVAGDVTEPNLGLDKETFEQLAEQVDSVLHCAAAVRFDQPLEEARHINVEGTRQALGLALQAQQGGREGRFDYISTAYVAGKRRGTIYEDELEHKKGFRNTYEQSKYEAEQLVRQMQTKLPTTILRPSIIVGNSNTGETTNFKAFYWPIRVYATGQMRILPGVASCRPDLVPVDYVAAATLYLTSLPDTVGKCFHLTTGHQNLITLREIMEETIKFFGIKSPPLVHPAFLQLLKGRTGRMLLGERIHKTLMLGMPYYPYLSVNLEFDDTQTRSYLDPVGLDAPSVRTFFNRLFQFCVESNWGKASNNNN